MPTLRPYQREALNARRAATDGNRQAIEMATGLGKTITFAVEAKESLEAGEGDRALILVHTEELARQAETKVKLMAPECTVGVVMAGRDETNADIVIGSVPTLARVERRLRLTGVGRVIVDEAHHAVANSYGTVLQHFNAEPGVLNTWPVRPDGTGAIPATGYSATLSRTDGKSLGNVWQGIAFSRGISWAVRKGYLVPPVGYRVHVPELGQIADGSKDRADAVLAESIAPERVVDAWLKHGYGRSTILFAPLVRSATTFAETFHRAGVSAAVVWGDMPAQDREDALAAYERGEITVLCNAMMLTEGLDIPRTKCVIVARPIRSVPVSPLFIQMAGRGLRPWLEPEAPPVEDQDCVLLVVGDTSPNLASVADLSERPIEPEDGKSLIALEDEFDLSRGLEPDPEHLYDGRVHVSEFDPLVARSRKVWGTTKGGTLFVPSGFGGYAFIAPDSPGYAVAYVNGKGGKREHRHIPDLEFAMALGEDVAQDRGGNLAALVADKGRAWRAGRPSEDQKSLAIRMGLERELERIMAARAGGKAGKLSDLMDKVRASQLVDPVVEKIKQRTGR
jgi:superfamily II DNA or RNA helicase